MTNRTPHVGRPAAITNGVFVAALDTALVAAGASMLWLNGRTSVIDLPVAAFVVTVLVGAFFVAVRRAVSYRRRFDRTQPQAVLAERTTVVIWTVLLAAAFAVWQVTDTYELGWGVTFASIGLLVANALLLMSDVTTGSRRVPSRQARLHARRVASVEVLHVAAAVVGIIGIALTSPIHQWRSDVLNGTVLLIAVTIGVGSAAQALLALTFTRNAVAAIPAEIAGDRG